MATLHARDVSIKLQAANTAVVSANTVLGNLFGSAVSVVTAKSMELDEGEQTFEQQDYLGTTSGFQNQAKVRKPKGPATLKFTVDEEDIQTLHALVYDSSSTPSGYTTYRSGNSTRKNVQVLVDIDDGTDRASYVLDNAENQKPMQKVTGVDGNMEYEFELKCLAKDLYGPQWKN